jgi:hypothetical protein
LPPLAVLISVSVVRSGYARPAAGRRLGKASQNYAVARRILCD